MVKKCVCVYPKVVGRLTNAPPSVIFKQDCVWSRLNDPVLVIKSGRIRLCPWPSSACLAQQSIQSDKSVILYLQYLLQI